ncbi:MAG: glycoside hydrolase family 97 protein [Paludibacter sp.]|nr:glycoside hydrolase family 97 protein [Bacteroidales bacterium]MCM1069626.1 glycoside hydrolase family 97 protein [Prevotella sp.]MCM1354272.1 glycoside hydrolase family 97 protein [Bacteroides sp.]MCM1443111.1 glycoside hydrolase family 97 protein [Muribaculum sp.]MCM1482346.1 glycoside hydrolase family 97 protein [Paludibacter sp.]
MKHLHLLSLAACLLWLTGCQQDKKQVTSPDGVTTITFSLSEKGQPCWEVCKNGNAIILTSPLGFNLDNANLSENFQITDTQRDCKDEIWQQPWGEEVDVRNQYNELCISLRQKQSGMPLILVFRAFNDGVAFRYEFPDYADNPSFRIMEELTEYRFANDAKVWWIPWNVKYYESLWTRTPLSQLTDTVSSPITLELSDGTYIFLHEANLTDYAAQNLSPVAGETTLRTMLTPWSDGTKVYAQWGTTVSPWRFLTLADNLNQLVNSRIMLNLNEPCRIEDTSWIQPLKYIGIWWGMHMESFTWCQGPKHGATTANTMRYIDFAAEHNIQGVLVEGWNYGWDGDWSANGDNFSFTRPYPDYDIEQLATYANAKGVKIIGHNETGGSTVNYENQLDSAFAFFNRYGIADVKTGYVNDVLDGKELHKSQYGVRHYRKVIETAAKYHITIDNHEPVMPTGLQRTYPNLVSQEGVRGAEWDAWSTDGGSPAEHMCVLPFTRGLAGPTDFTFGTFSFSNPVYPQTRVHSTLAKQLALYVVIYSPLQMASDLPEHYENQPAFRFIEDVPVDWQQTIVPDGKIGDFVVTARQDKYSEDWYIGAITDENPRELDINLDFLPQGNTYMAQIYRDAPDADWDTNPYPIIIEEVLLQSGDTWHVHLAAGGGCALRLIPQP